MSEKIEKLCSKAVQQQSVINQFFAAVVVNLLTLVYGINCGFPSSANILFQSDDTPLPSGKITDGEISWIASISYMGGLVGNFVFGFITSRFGRKKPLIFIAIFNIVAWLLILFAQNVFYLYAARFFNGFVGGSLFVMVPLFVTEISNDNVRGILGSMLIFAANFGIVFAYILGDFCNYIVTPIVSIVLAVAYAIAMTFFPESPTFLVKQNKLTEAEESLRFYQNTSTDLNKLKNVIEKCNETKFSWSDLMQNPGRKAMIIGASLSLLSTMCGISSLLCYTANIFKEAGSNMSPNKSAILVGTIQFLGSFITTTLVDRTGRKLLYTLSSITTGFSFIVLGTYMMLKSWEIDVEPYNWVPIASFSFALLAGACGVMTLPFVVLSEVMPEHLKEFGASVCMSIIWLSVFIIAKSLPSLNSVIGFHGSMFLFGGICTFSTILIIMFLPETKGKSYEEIMKLLR